MESDNHNKSEVNESGFNSLSEMPSFEEVQANRAQDVEKISQPEEELERQKNFNKFLNFIKRDAEIKQALSDLAPSDLDLYGGEEAATKYSDKLFYGFRDIYNDLDGMTKDYYNSESVTNKLTKIFTNLTSAGADPRKLQQCYRNDFAAMDPEFNDKVRSRLVGIFVDEETVDELGKEAKSVNEILHLMHTAVFNDEHVLESLPVLRASDDRSVQLFGNAESFNSVAGEIFEMSKDRGENFIDIVSMQDRTFMMVRDRAHALTIDITKDHDNSYYVNYFLPNIINADMVNALPGVRKVTKKDHYSGEFTTGVFRVEDESEVANKVIDFINHVPTDDDGEKPATLMTGDYINL